MSVQLSGENDVNCEGYNFKRKEFCEKNKNSWTTYTKKKII